MSVARAAGEVGYESEAAFNRAFKKRTLQTPREYFYDSRVED
ncbi:MAG: AraC family transcriptional regulator [Spirosomaceae bacterium]|nr:AraC family transcriptional regulator [Spirosomataceae bacterium]